MPLIHITFILFSSSFFSASEFQGQSRHLLVRLHLILEILPCFGFLSDTLKLSLTSKILHTIKEFISQQQMVS